MWACAGRRARRRENAHGLTQSESMCLLRTTTRFGSLDGTVLDPGTYFLTEGHTSCIVYARPLGMFTQWFLVNGRVGYLVVIGYSLVNPCTCHPRPRLPSRLLASLAFTIGPPLISPWVSEDAKGHS